MVIFVLYVKADLTGIDSISVSPGANLCISVRNPLDHDQVHEKVVIETDELTRPPEGGRTLVRKWQTEPCCQFALRWDGARQSSTIQVIDMTHRKGRNSESYPRAMTDKDSGQFVPMLALDCLGLEPYAFHPMGNEFVVTNKYGVTFTKVDLSRGIWSEYDSALGATTIENFVTKFV